jgi:hypothetical protein
MQPEFAGGKRLSVRPPRQTSAGIRSNSRWVVVSLPYSATSDARALIATIVFPHASDR